MTSGAPLGILHRWHTIQLRQFSCQAVGRLKSTPPTAAGRCAAMFAGAVDSVRTNLAQRCYDGEDLRGAFSLSGETSR